MKALVELKRSEAIHRGFDGDELGQSLDQSSTNLDKTSQIDSTCPTKRKGRGYSPGFAGPRIADS